MNPRICSSAADELFALQVAQLKHDEYYHREIARLTVHARLNHMALHLQPRFFWITLNFLRDGPVNMEQVFHLHK